MSFTTSDGVRLAVEKEGTGPGLVLVHGFGGAKEDFSDHVSALARDHTVVIFDHRGHGESEKPDDPAAYSFERMVADVLEVADWAGFDSFRLLGHSMGGMIARKVVIVAPERIDALVMMDTSCGPIPGFDADLIEAAAEVAVTQGKAALKELLDIAPVLQTPAYQRVLAERAGYQAFEERKWADLSVVMWGVMVREMAHQTDDLAALASTLPAPLMVLVGEQDKPFVIASHAMKQAIPAAELVVIKNAGHSPQFENPEAWMEAMTKFLAPIS
jgi:pimeloyl-ACP methyl ester carboxylesterase